jgi:hypothetical protein
MLYTVCTVFDCAAEEAGPTFLSRSVETAFRDFEKMMKDNVDWMDYKLFLIATYDSVSMKIEPYKEPQSVTLSMVADYIQRRKNNAGEKSL